MATKSRYMTSSERTAIWERWQAGETVAHISRALNRVPKSVRSERKKHFLGTFCCNKKYLVRRDETRPAVAEGLIADKSPVT